MRLPACQIPRQLGGYTLIELVVATALLAFLIQLAVPPMSRMLSDWQRDHATRAITDHLALARSEAIRWSQRVVMCSSLDGLRCSPGTNREWKSGWLVFQDLDGNGQFNSSDKLVVVSHGASGIQSIRGNALIQRFVFMPTGMMASGMGTLEIVPRTGTIQRIIVNRIGRVRLSVGLQAA
ncbi:GspH/FimT family pseudopilin [Hydrogenophaga pseudoflava]|uniref:GspH/FimT family pseudopilin n=1 Tax=Hydrogenophaga pseudoflava TaxID=47421 RepID=UPI0027E53312|nr:GspH/FimT family pseudopilin [Hydrogenophaga pseudoflava]MDQ7747371.1 GspH/FimT family pseudopilin [Hydrogenophaga pseudoflava]